MTAASNLPSRREILRNALDSLNTGRGGLSEARDWLASDWSPIDSSLPDGAAPHWQAARKRIAEAKGLIDAAKNALYEALDAEPQPAPPASLDAAQINRPEVQESARRLMLHAAALTAARSTYHRADANRSRVSVDEHQDAMYRWRDAEQREADERARLAELLGVAPSDLVSGQDLVTYSPLYDTDTDTDTNTNDTDDTGPADRRQVIARRDAEQQGGGDDGQ